MIPRKPLVCHHDIITSSIQSESGREELRKIPYLDRTIPFQQQPCPLPLHCTPQHTSILHRHACVLKSVWQLPYLTRSSNSSAPSIAFALFCKLLDYLGHIEFNPFESHDDGRSINPFRRIFIVVIIGVERRAADRQPYVRVLWDGVDSKRS